MENNEQNASQQQPPQSSQQLQSQSQPQMPQSVSPVQIPPTNPISLIGAWANFIASIKFFANNAVLILKVFAIPTLFAFLAEVLFEIIPNYNEGIYLSLVLSVIYMLLNIASFVFTIFAISGFSKHICVNPTNFSSAGFREIYKEGFELFWQVIWLGVLSFFVFTGAGIFFGVPGIIVAVFSAVSLFVLAGENIFGIKAIHKSWLYVKGKWWNTFWRAIVFPALIGIFVSLILWLIVTAVAFLFGGMVRMVEGQMVFLGINENLIFVMNVLLMLITNLIFVPIGYKYIHGIYDSLKNSKNPEEVVLENESNRKVRKWLTAFLIIGIVVVCLIVALIAFMVLFGIWNATVDMRMVV